MPDDILINVEGVSKKFCRKLKRSLLYGLQDIGSELIGRSRVPELRKDEFWAVNDVSFELKRGECLGLIGHNGAGKSTLLKMLNGLIKPDKGRIELKGRIGALIELGTGFNPILTGRENIYNNGAVLGFTKKEIDQKFDAIVDFAEIGDFIDTPIQNYSSGMKVRLGFSVAAQMEPDVLLVDEVLAVGDLNFRLKCFNLIDQIVEKSAVIFVSHSMQLVSRLCNQILMMEGGREMYKGSDVSEGIDRYYKSLVGTTTDFIRNDLYVKILDVKINNKSDALPLVNRLDDLIIVFYIELSNNYLSAMPAITILDFEQKGVGICVSDKPINKVGKIIEQKPNSSVFEFGIRIPRIILSKGIYYITFTMSENYRSKPLSRLNNIKAFQVTSGMDTWPPIEFEAFWT